MESLPPQVLATRLVQLRLIDRMAVDEVLLATNPTTGSQLLSALEVKSLLTPFQLTKIRKGETDDFYISRYKLLYKVSAGTFARVFRAIDPGSGQVVAIKILRGRQTMDPENVKHFLREGRLVKGFDHPNIARVHEVGMDQESNKYYIAMDFVEGGNLREIMKIRKTIAPAEFVGFAREMVEGLRYALSRGVTHRDIKPTNILIAADGHVRWVDFGLAGVTEASMNKAFDIQQEQRTIDYAGLERATGAPKGDPRSDIFFLGNVFYQMLTGEPALEDSKDRQSRMLRNRFENSKPLSSRTDIPASVAKVVDQMLKFKPDERYQNYDQILKDLDECNLGDGKSPADAGAPKKPEKPRIAVVHSDPKIQEVIKAKFTEKGAQVVVTADVERAAMLHGMKPFEVLAIDLTSTGEAGVKCFQRLVNSNQTKPPVGVFLVDGDEAKWLSKLRNATVATVQKPLTLRALYQTVLNHTSLSKDNGIE